MKTVRSCLQHLFHVYSSMSYLFSMGWLNFQNSFIFCGVGTEHKFFRKIFSYVLRISRGNADVQKCQHFEYNGINFLKDINRNESSKLTR